MRRAPGTVGGAARLVAGGTAAAADKRGWRTRVLIDINDLPASWATSPSSRRDRIGARTAPRAAGVPPSSRPRSRSSATPERVSPPGGAHTRTSALLCQNDPRGPLRVATRSRKLVDPEPAGRARVHKEEFPPRPYQGPVRDNEISPSAIPCTRRARATRGERGPVTGLWCLRGASGWKAGSSSTNGRTRGRGRTRPPARDLHRAARAGPVRELSPRPHIAAAEAARPQKQRGSADYTAPATS